jgi:hypothetical protein
MPDIAELIAGDFALHAEFTYGPSGARCPKGFRFSRAC